MRMLAGILILWVVCAFILLGITMLGYVYVITWQKITGLWILITCFLFIVGVARMNND